MKFVIFRISTGQIMAAGEDPDPRFVELQHNPAMDISALEVEDYEGFNNFYVADGEYTPRPAMGISLDRSVIRADGLDFATLSPLPEGASVLLNDVATKTDGSSLRITAERPGYVRVNVEHFPHLPVVLHVEATADGAT